MTLGKDQEVIDHLNTENAYLEGWFASGLDERDKLFQEITDRIPKKEDSVPIRLKNYEYFRRYEPENEYAIYIRRKNKNSEEIVLLDVNELAHGKDFYQLANWSISPSESLMANAEDINGRRQYSIKFKDLVKMRPMTCHREYIGRYGMVCRRRRLFYVLRDEETLLPHKVFRHKVGTSQDKDELVYEEKDTTFICLLAIHVPWSLLS